MSEQLNNKQVNTSSTSEQGSGAAPARHYEDRRADRGQTSSDERRFGEERKSRNTRKSDSGHSRNGSGSRRDFSRNASGERGGRRDSGRNNNRFRDTKQRASKRSDDKTPAQYLRSKVSPARKAALEVCRLVRERDAFAQDLISSRIDSSSMSREDRAFATKLVLGVVSSRGTLDEIINRCLRSPDDIQDDVRDALRISVYEMYFLDKSPHAAVDEGVELVRACAPRASGLANFALHRALDLKAEFPFGNPKADLDAFARQYAFPVWLARRLVADLGLEAACDFMEASNEPAPVFVAINAARATDAEVVAELERAHGDPQACGEGCYKLSSGRVLQDGRIKHMISQGMLFVSDASSQEIARLILPDTAPQSFLEIGAGRGTKTLLIQQNALRKYGAQIENYLTLDSHAYKTELLTFRAETYGIHISEPVTGNAEKLDEVFGKRTFNAIFIDAPCTGLGTLRRHPEIRWRVSEDTIETMAKIGLSMLKSAAAHVCVGGTLAYATCTITHAENNAVVMAFLESEEGKAFSLCPINGKGCFASRLQSGGADAHFAVKMVRTQ